jgi:hypothetical protein
MRLIDTFYMTDKPCGVNNKLWDDILETIRTGLDVGIHMTVYALLYEYLDKVF